MIAGNSFHEILIVATAFSRQPGHYLPYFNLSPDGQMPRMIGFGQSLAGEFYQWDASSNTRLDIVLCGENELLAAKQEKQLRSLLAGEPLAHFVGHRRNIREYESWVDSLTGGRYFSRIEGSTDGPTFEFLCSLGKYWKEEDLDGYYRRLASFFHQSRFISLEMCKLQMLNEWDADKLTLYSDPGMWEKLSFAWKQLLLEYPDLLAYLKGFEHKPQTDQVLYERMKLAAYLYPA